MKNKIKISNYSEECPNPGLSNGTTLEPILSGRTIIKNGKFLYILVKVFFDWQLKKKILSLVKDEKNARFAKMLVA
jgi:hypothetical protein